MRVHSCLLTAACAVGFLGTAVAAPAPHHRHAEYAGTTAADTLITTSIFLNVTDLQGLQNFVADTTAPGSPNYHRFLTVRQFRDRFAPSDLAIGQFVRYLRSFGIRVDKIYPDNLDITATGTADEFNAAFSTQLRDYTRDGQRFHRPAGKYVLPSEFSTLVLSVPGLSNEPGDFHSHIARLGQGAYSDQTAPAVTWPRNGTASATPGQFTVGDAAGFYDVNPLYREGIQGRGQTLGIMTLANFREQDAYAYWRNIGLRVRPNRISKVMVDGGVRISDGQGGNAETSLDVEQSGGLAPDASIRVYIAPNNNDGFIDLFYTAASENLADTVSISWGQPEEAYFAGLNEGVDYTGQLRAIDQALLEGAAQGQSFFAASGDSGAYDMNNPKIPYHFAQVLSVDAPANDPYITAAGGTTVPATLNSVKHPSCPTITIPNEQVWGWDYINNDWASCYPFAPNALFPVGGGGGVSSFWPIPYYQQPVGGMQQTQPGQSVIYYPNFPATDGAQDLIDLPAGFAGRNLPDLALNADPETGYVVIDCTDYPRSKTNHDCAATGFGGTSFAAPQLNGITALIDQAAGGRVGLLNPVIYPLQQLTANWSYHRPFNDITAGDNWFYDGVPGYDDGAGIGTINAANLAWAYMMFAEGGGDGGR